MASVKDSALTRLPPAGRVGVGVLLVVLVAAGYWLVFYSDVSTKIASTKAQGQTLNNDLASQKAALADYVKDKDELTVRQQRQRDFNKALPETTEVASFLSSLQSVANVAGIDLKGWQPQDEKPDAFYTRVPMKIEVSGHFQQIAKFAYEVSKVDRIINLENIEISDPKPEGNDVTLKVKSLATTFHANAARPAGSAAPGAPPPAGTPK